MSEAGEHVSEGRAAVSAKGESSRKAADAGSVKATFQVLASRRVTSRVAAPRLVLQDKRSATKKCKDVLSELSVTRAKADRELDELRENLRLAHCALDQAR